MVNKDVTHSKMRRRIEKPRILLLDCNLEYTKGESKTDMEVRFVAIDGFIAAICSPAAREGVLLVIRA